MAETIVTGKNSGKAWYIEMVRLIAMLLISWAHFVGTGTYNLEIPGVINGVMPQPLLPGSEHTLTAAEVFTFQQFNIEFATLGVILFFLISGYFIPALQEKQLKRDTPWNGGLLVSRMTAFYPTMFLCVAAVGLLVWLTQSITYSPLDYFATATATQTFLPAQNLTIGPLWYMLVLFFTYLVCTIVPKLSLRNLPAIYLCLAFLVVLPACCAGTPLYGLLRKIAHAARYTTIPLLGSAAALCHRDRENISKFGTVLIFGSFFGMTMLILNLAAGLYGDVGTYADKNPFLASFLIIALMWVLNKVAGRTFEKLSPLLVWVKRVSFAFYLLHVHFGLITIYYLRNRGASVGLSLLAAYIVAITAAVVVTLIVEKFTAFVKAQIIH